MHGASRCWLGALHAHKFLPTQVAGQAFVVIKQYGTITNEQILCVLQRLGGTVQHTIWFIYVVTRAVDPITHLELAFEDESVRRA